MRLLNVFTGKLEEYFGSAIPKYAILSHTWGRDEVTFSDIQNVGNGAQATDTGSSGMETCSEPPIAVTITSTEATRKEDEAPETDARVAVPRARDFVSESQDLALEAQSPIPEPSSPQGPIYEEKRSTEMQNLVMKYKKVKMFYFDKTVQVKQLQDKLKNEPLNKGLLDRIQHFDSDHMYSIEVGSDYERLLSKYKRVKTLYFRRQAQLEFLQKVLERWTSPRTGENVPVAQNPSRQSKAGYKKVRYACEQAISDDYEYVWIDTCCIDKSSSAELSEAINSMFQWYQNAGVCYAYVEDVQLENFGTSRWFTRGWTLQELLAPAEVIFFGSEWTRLGTKSDLANQIITVTRIDEKALLHQDQLKKKSVAQRMSWASRRETTRLEDAAYCLLGIFGVNMPLLYGEGKNAFFRLQEEVLKSTVDQSLFSWSMASANYTHRGSCGIFAESPGDYQYSSSVVPFQRSTDTAPYVMTNKGLQIEMPLIQSSGYVLGLLDCQFQDEISTCIAIVLLRTHTPDVFFRTKGATVSESPVEGENLVEGGAREGGGLVVVTHQQALQAVIRRIYIPRDEYEVPLQRFSYQVKFSQLQEHGFRLVSTRPNRIGHSNVRWNEQAQSMHIDSVLRSAFQSIAFVFHHSERKVAFAVYFDDDASIDTEESRSDDGSLVKGERMDLWLSSLVEEPDPNNLPRPSYTVEDWWYSLSYGVDPHGIAVERHTRLLFSIPDANGIDGPCIIYGNLEAGNHFGQKVRVFYLYLSPVDLRPSRPQFVGGQDQLSSNYLATYFSSLPEVVPSSNDRDHHNGIPAQTPTARPTTKHPWRSLNFKRNK